MDNSENTNKNLNNFWFDKPSILFDNQKMYNFFPKKNMSIEEQLNSLVRLSMIITLFLILINKEVNYIYINIFCLIFTYLIYNYSKNERESFSDNLEKRIVKPTQDNPFMNVIQTDYSDNPNREAISKLSNNINYEVNNEIDKHFNYNLYNDIEDIFNRRNSQRQFYTTPVTTIPNEQTKFAKWLYNSPPTCKEGNGYSCIKNNFDHLKDSKHRN
tara:strand:+ start:1344 stop:1988 length:645 start_codon:yes stop_codon:yes gene_type:complete